MACGGCPCCMVLRFAFGIQPACIPIGPLGTACGTCSCCRPIFAVVAQDHWQARQAQQDSTQTANQPSNVTSPYSPQTTMPAASASRAGPPAPARQPVVATAVPHPAVPCRLTAPIPSYLPSRHSMWFGHQSGTPARHVPAVSHQVLAPGYHINGRHVKCPPLPRPLRSAGDISYLPPNSDPSQAYSSEERMRHTCILHLSGKACDKLDCQSLHVCQAWRHGSCPSGENEIHVEKFAVPPHQLIQPDVVAVQRLVVHTKASCIAFRKLEHQECNLGNVCELGHDHEAIRRQMHTERRLRNIEGAGEKADVQVGDDKEEEVVDKENEVAKQEQTGQAEWLIRFD